MLAKNPSCQNSEDLNQIRHFIVKKVKSSIDSAQKHQRNDNIDAVYSGEQSLLHEDGVSSASGASSIKISELVSRQIFTQEHKQRSTKKK